MKALDPKYLIVFLITLVLVVGEARYSILGGYDRLATTLGVCLVTEAVLSWWLRGRVANLASAYITGISLALLTKPQANILWPFALGAFLAIASKYVLTYRHRHLWNPSNFAIALLVLVASDSVAILSHQWGNDLRINLVIWAFGLAVAWRARVLHVTLTYVACFVILALLRYFIIGGPLMAELAPITGPMYQLFIFFMVTDPRTTLSTARGRMIVVAIVALLEAVLRLAGDLQLPLLRPFYVSPPILALAIVGPIAMWWDLRRTGRQAQARTGTPVPLASALALACLWLSGCNAPTQGEMLARTYCSACHAFPEAALLDTRTWQAGVLPQMAPRLGVTTGSVFSEASKNPYMTVLTRAVTEREWDRIFRYYADESPDTLPPQAVPAEPQVDPEFFAVRPLAPRMPSGAIITLLEADSAHEWLFVGEAATQTLLTFDWRGRVRATLKIGSPPTDVLVDGDRVLLLESGILQPNDDPRGRLARYDLSPDGALRFRGVVIDSLFRPVFVESFDFNRDGLGDFLICESGNNRGRLALYRSTATGGGYVRQVLDPSPGAIRSEIRDLTGDGAPDIVALFGQGDERIVLFENDGKGGFAAPPRVLARFPPVYGSMFFAMYDFNGDGRLDIVYVNGDNFDYSRVLKPYHGVRILENDGRNTFTERYFFPVYGAAQAAVADFDGDGDLDMLAASNVADSARHPERGIMFFENTGSYRFTPYAFGAAARNQWNVMAAADFNKDGRLDAVVGAMNMETIATLQGRPGGGSPGGRKDPILLFEGRGRADAAIRSVLQTVEIQSGRIDTVYRAERHFEAPNWSRDGRFFVVNSDGRLYRLAADNPRGLEEIPTGFATRVNNDHGISPDGSWLVLSHSAAEHITDPAQDWLASSVYVMPIEGSRTPRKVTTKAPSFWHGWSPDGKTLAFVGRRDNEFDIYTIPVAGGAERRVTTCPGLDDGPDYSPDGAFIYYNSSCGGSMQIWRMHPDGSGAEQLTRDEYANWFPHPSPDGRWVVYLAYLEDQGEAHPFGKQVKLRLMDARTGLVRDLTPPFFGGQGTLNVPSWSPDSRRVAFVSYEQR